MTLQPTRPTSDAGDADRSAAVVSDFWSGLFDHPLAASLLLVGSAAGVVMWFGR